MRNKFILGISLILFTISSAQVGINTTTPNGATVLDIYSNTKGVLIPRLTDAERNTSLADNDLDTSPPNVDPLNGNPALTKGTLIFNTTSDRFEFWDGLQWRQLFVATSSAAGNDGVVKIDGGLNGLKPVVTNFGNNSGFGNEMQVIYTTPLTFAPNPTTSWPETTPDNGNPTLMTPFIYDGTTNKFKENPIRGQVHIWRVIINLTAGANSAGSVMATLRNPVSGFQVTSVQLIPAGSANGSILTFNFYTIADDASIPPTQGYQLYLDANKVVSAEVLSVTRVSLFKD